MLQIRALLTPPCLVGLMDEKEGVEDATHVSGLRNWGTVVH